MFIGFVGSRGDGLRNTEDPNGKEQGTRHAIWGFMSGFIGSNKYQCRFEICLNTPRQVAEMVPPLFGPPETTAAISGGLCFAGLGFRVNGR